MSKLLCDIPFRALLPSSIKDDPQIRAAAKALDGVFHQTTRAIPKLLIWARLERETAALIAPLERLRTAAGGLRAHTGAGLELLAWQLHVDFREVATDDLMLERMVRESIPWHRLKGTPAAVEQALAMYDIQARTDESGTGRNWAVYELELQSPPTTRDLLNIVRVAEEAGPKRSWLRRVHDQYDHRPIILDVGPPLDDGFLDDDSGVWNAEAGVKESFGNIYGLISEVCFKDCRAGLGQHQLRPILVYYLNRPLLDHWALDSEIIKSRGVAGFSMMILKSQALEGRRHYWVGPWDQRPWCEAGHTLPIRRMDRRREVSKSQLVLDFNSLDNSLNRIDRPWGPVAQPPLRLDQDRLDFSDADMGGGLAVFDELFIDHRGLAVPSTDRSRAADFAVSQTWAAQSAARPSGEPGGLNISEQYCQVLGLAGRQARNSWSGPWNGYWYRQAFINVINIYA